MAPTKDSRESEHLLKKDNESDERTNKNYCSSDSEVEVLPRVQCSEPIKVYRRRWYILGVYAALNVISVFYTNTFSPIQEPVKLIFYWEDWNVLLINAVTTLSSIFLSAPFGWLVVAKG